MKKAPPLASSSFAVVADLRPASPTIVLMTPVCMPAVVLGEADTRYDHRLAVLFDEDEDERVIDMLTAILYRSPLTFSKIAAVYEHKGYVIVWMQGTTHVDDRLIIAQAATNSTVLRGDSWSDEVREIHPDEGAQPKADEHDRLVRAVDSIIPLGAPLGAIDWRRPPLPDPQPDSELRKIIAGLDKITPPLKRGGGGRRE